MIRDKDAASNYVFSDSWWQRFQEQTGGLTRPSVFKDCLDEERIAFYQEAVLHIVRDLAALRTVQYGYRVYIDGRQLDSDEMEQIFDLPPAPGETFAAWVARAFGQRKFGMIINSGEKFHLGLMTDVAATLAPLFQDIGLPRDGINFTIFIGNYDQTPLGIHQDKRGENVMHFHLGPGSKTMHLWDKQQYLALSAQDGFDRKQIEALRVHATEYTFGSGDLFFMPEGEYHIGSQDGLSMGLTVWQYNHSDDLLAKHLHERLFKQVRVTQSQRIRDDRNPLDDSSALDELLAVYRVRDELKDMNYSELLRETYTEWRYCVHSNAGYRHPPFELEDAAALTPDDVVQSEYPYQIQVRTSEAGKMQVYVRGRRIDFKHFPCVQAMIAAINQGRRHRVSELLAMLDADWDRRIGLYILDQLHQRRGLRRVA
ncbi:MAG: hypothetical protein V4578_26710 [Pseudomonadota bacterium]